jgi:hypothetical protein
MTSSQVRHRIDSGKECPEKDLCSGVVRWISPLLLRKNKGSRERWGAGFSFDMGMFLAVEMNV